MSALANSRLEAFAQALASGQSAHLAAQKAGYDSRPSNAKVRAARRDVTSRVAELLAEAATADRDLRPLIAELTRLGTTSAAADTPAGLVAARWLLVEAARLKSQLPPPVRPSMSLSNAEWNKIYGPKAHHNP